MRYLLALLILPVVAGPSHAQPATCVDGVATADGIDFACHEINLLSRVSIEQMNAASGNDVWGWTDSLTGQEYALMGLNDGTFFVDVTVPEAPLLLGKLPTASAPSLWRDMKVYADHMFVVSEAAEHGMQVFDLRHLRGLSHDPSRLFEADALFTGEAPFDLSRAHNVAINEDTGYAYVVGGKTFPPHQPLCSGGLYIVDISTPLAPEFVGCFAEDGYTHDVQCVIYEGPDLRYQGAEICFASNEDTVTIVDVTDKQAPQFISHGTYPFTAYTHQGWLTSDQRYFFVNDELDETNIPEVQNTRTIVMDVSDLEQPFYVGSYFHPTTSITHNLFIRDDFVFASNYMTGLRILNANPLVGGRGVESLATVAYFDTYYQRACVEPDPECVGQSGFRGAWSNYPFFASGTVLVSDINNGLFILRPANLPVSTTVAPAAPQATINVFPDPFLGRAVVELTVQTDQHVHAEVFDLLGRRVLLVYEGMAAAANPISIHMDAGSLPAGAYVLRVAGEDFVVSRRITRVGR